MLDARGSSWSPPPVHFSGGRTGIPAALLLGLQGPSGDSCTQPAPGSQEPHQTRTALLPGGGRRAESALCATSQCSGGSSRRKRRGKEGRSGRGGQWVKSGSSQSGGTEDGGRRTQLLSGAALRCRQTLLSSAGCSLPSGLRLPLDLTQVSSAGGGRKSLQQRCGAGRGAQLRKRCWLCRFPSSQGQKGSWLWLLRLGVG